MNASLLTSTRLTGAATLIGRRFFARLLNVPSHLHNDTFTTDVFFCLTMNTTRYTRESHTRVYIANVNDCASFYPPRASRSITPSHHPPRFVQLPRPVCALTCSSDAPAQARRGSSGAHTVSFAFALLLLGSVCGVDL